MAMPGGSSVFTTRFIETRNVDPDGEGLVRPLFERQGGGCGPLRCTTVQCARLRRHLLAPHALAKSPLLMGLHRQTCLDRGSRGDGRMDFIEPGPLLLPHDLDFSSCSENPEKVAGAPVSYANV
jgi:hypothetical protein